MLVVFEDHELVLLRRELRVGGEEDREVGLSVFEHLVAEADVDRGERLELQPVVLFEPGQAVDPLAALGRPVEGQFFRLAFQVGDRLSGRSSSAVFFSVPTALALANGVGGNAVSPSFSNSALAFS